jgi:hypothetical protein
MAVKRLYVLHTNVCIEFKVACSAFQFAVVEARLFQNVVSTEVTTPIIRVPKHRVGL